MAVAGGMPTEARLGDEGEDARRAAGAIHEGQHPHEHGRAEGRHRPQVLEPLEVPHTDRMAHLAVDLEVRVPAGIHAQGVDAEAHDLALLYEEAGGLDAVARESERARLTGIPDRIGVALLPARAQEHHA